MSLFTRRKTYYIAPVGDNVNPGSCRAPLASLARALQACRLDGYAKHRLYLRPGDYLVGPLRLLSNLEIIFLNNGDGCSLKAVPDRFHPHSYKSWRADPFFDFTDCDNVRLHGPVTCSMDTSKFLPALNTGYHGLKMEFCRNIYVNGLTFVGPAGDGVHCAYGAENIRLVRVAVSNPRRNGFTVQSAQKLYMYDCSAAGAAGVRHRNGLDFEAETSNDRLEEISISKFTAAMHGGCGLQMSFGKLGRLPDQSGWIDPPNPIGIKITGVDLTGSGEGLHLSGLTERGPGGRIYLRDIQTDKQMNFYKTSNKCRLVTANLTAHQGVHFYGRKAHLPARIRSTVC